MPRREIGLMGYVGEIVIEHWLRQKYPSPEYTVVRQIIPSRVPKKGGGYLDFGVIRKNVVRNIYEVKSQDYIFGKDSKINSALRYIWDSKGEALNFEIQEGDKYAGHENIPAHLILLVAPNDEGRKVIGEKNIRYVTLFEEIWDVIENVGISDRVMDISREDIKKVISILKRPTAGIGIKKSFLDLRDRLRKNT